MFVDFRLAVNTGNEYTDLFPRTDMEGVIDKNQALKYSERIVDVEPVAEGTQIQKVAFSPQLTVEQTYGVFFVELMTEGEQAQKDFDTIVQCRIEFPNEMSVMRLYSWPTATIKLKLIFQEAHGTYDEEESYQDEVEV